jgi:hypothetical protein
MKTPPKHWQNTSLQHIPGERWTDCIFIDTNGKSYDYGDLYKVSTMGRVKNTPHLHKIRKDCTIPVKERIMRPDNLNGTDYLRVRLTKNGKSSALLVHRLVMLCFTEKIPGKDKVNHKKGVKWDNRLKMLEWSDHPENIQHAYDTGLHHGRPGEESAMAKIDNKTALLIFDSAGTQHEIAIKFNVSRSVVCAIKRGATWGKITNKQLVKERFPLSTSDILAIRLSNKLATDLAKQYKKSVKLIRLIRNAV